MIKKRKAPACGHTTGAIAEIIREQYSTNEKEYQYDDLINDAIGFALSIVGVIAMVVVMICIKVVIGW